jgi:uncharacterized protein YndB with AHSA1/START domain
MDPYVDIVEHVHVEATTGEVWRTVTDISRHPEFAGPKSITKEIDFDGDLVSGARWIAHERFGPQKFDAPSEITAVEPEHYLAWVSFPPMKEQNRGEGGKVLWSYTLDPEDGGTRLTHQMQVLLPAKGAGMLKLMYAVFRLPKKQREGARTTLTNVKNAAEKV